MVLSGWTAACETDRTIKRTFTETHQVTLPVQGLSITFHSEGVVRRDLKPKHPGRGTDDQVEASCDSVRRGTPARAA